MSRRPPAAGSENSVALKNQALDRLRLRARRCARCPLSAGPRLVFGEGNAESDVVFVGEAPGAREEATGRPFVGAAGRVLERMLAALGWRREEIYICNLLKCRPPGNRRPRPEEAAACAGWLEAQLAILRPRAVVALGASAAQTLLASAETIGALRGRPHAYGRTRLWPLLHPAALLYQPSNRDLMWGDLRALARGLGRPAPDRRRWFPARPGSA